jgi:hypothetical protein
MSLTIGELTPATWMLFGEAYSKGDHLFHVPLRPDMAASQERYYRDQVLTAMAAFSGSLLPAQMLANAETAYDEIEHDVVHRRSLGLTPQAIIYFNALLVRDVKGGLGLADYQATFDDLQSLCDEFNRPAVQSTEPERVFCAIFIKAVLLHVSLATREYFPSANRATAMLLHHAVLIETAMMPKRYAHLLSMFYGTDPERYATELARSEQSGDATSFVDYSIGGMVAQMRHDMEQLRDVWPEQRRRIGWINYVYAVLADRPDPDRRRQIALALSMPPEPTQVPELHRLLGDEYGGDRSGEGLVRSDLVTLAERSLAREGTDGWLPCRDRLED